MTREVSRFGHAAKVWIAMWLAFSAFLLWFALSDWKDALGLFVLTSVLFGVNLWINMSQRVWYDDRKVCTRILGKGRSCIEYNKIASISASRSWKRAAAQRPISELKIVAHDGGEILISLRHLSLPDLQEMVGEIGQRTGLPAPELRKYVS